MRSLAIVSLFFCMTLCSCDKGYQVRFRNYNVEPMDSVIIGNAQVVFTDIETGTFTEYKKITRGNHGVMLVSKSKKRFYTHMFVSSKGEGNRTLQIDAINQVAVLEE